MDWKAFRRELHQIPELGFQETKTQQFLLNYLSTLPGHRVEIELWKTGLLVRVPGTESRQTLAYRADMDGLPLEEETGLPFRSRHPGMMHACGHDIHMTIAMAVLTELALHPVRDDIVFLFQPAEEGPGGAQPMLASEQFARWHPDVVFALHIAPEFPVGTVATRPGILFANTSELCINLVGIGGHAAYPHLANDMVVAAAHLVTQLHTIVARNVNPLDAAVLTIGKISGGTKQNIIAERARIEGTLRTLSTESMALVKQRIEQVVAGIETGFACRCHIDYGANYVQVYNHPETVKGFMEWLQQSQTAHLEVCREAMTGEDFGYFLQSVPGFMFWLGAGAAEGLHSARLNPSEEAIDVGIRVVQGYLRHLSSTQARP